MGLGTVGSGTATCSGDGMMAKLSMDGAIAKFSGDDKAYSSTKWAQDIDDNAEIFEWSAQQKLIVARRSLTGTAELWLRSEKAYKTYDELKAALMKEFPDTVNAKEMHEMMSTRKKRKDETYIQYMLTMKELGKRARFPDYVAIQYIIDGIDDHDEPCKIMLYGITQYTTLKEKLLVYEKVRSTRKTRPAKPLHLQSKQTASATIITGSRQGVRRCYNCGDQNHVAAECPNGLKCFKCNSYGHIGRNCTQQQVSTGANTGVSTQGTSKSFGSFRQRSAMYGSRVTDDVTSRGCTHELTNEIVNETQEGGLVPKGRVPSQPNQLQLEKTEVLTGDNKSWKIMQMQTENDKGCNRRRSVISVKMCDNVISALVDTGSEVNLINSLAFQCISEGKHTLLSDERIMLTGLGQTKVFSLGKVFLNVEIDCKMYKDVTFHVVPGETMPFEAILGNDFLKRCTVLFRDGFIRFLPDDCNWLEKIDYFTGCVSIVLDHVRNPVVKKEVLNCVEAYQPRKTEEAPIKLKIILKDDIPVAQRPRRLSLAEQQLVERQVEDWLKDGIIRVSFSDYSSPLVLVRKKDGSTRVCVDYRRLNKKIVKDEFPLPVIDDLIDKLQGAKIFSVLDLKNGFFHLKVSEECIRYTSFVTHHGQFEFLRAPFGLSICPKTFMRFVSVIFRNLIAKGIMMIFIDDIIIPALDEEQALERLRKVLDVASRYGLSINWKKVNLLQRQIEYLGHIIKDGEVMPSTEKIQVVASYPEPRTIKELHSFIGLTGYFRKYIEDYASIAKPLTDLLKKGQEFIFEEEQRSAFFYLKSKLMGEPVLKIFNPQLKTELHTDASSTAYAAILMQYHSNSGLHPVHFMSRRTNEAQSRYSSYELEALAIVEAVKKFRHYLYGIHFKIVTDCKAFELTLRKKDLTAKVARWVLALNEYDYELEHRAGTKMRHVDALSRIPYVAVNTAQKDILRHAQNEDDGLKAIKEILKEGSYEDYWMEDDILYKGDQKQLVVPKTLEKEIIKKVHSNGHFGKTKMKDLLNKDYYIRDIDKKIDEFLRSCIPCLLAARKEGKQEGFLNPIDKESLPFDTLHLDHVGPLTETKKQYNHILTVVDSFTKFVWLFPTKSTSSSETLNKLRIHQQTFGNPRRMITDRGTAFTSQEFQEYCKQENIQHIKITTGVPRGNGQVERVHRILIPALTKLCIENDGVWYRHVSKVQRALNSTFQRSINTTPFELLIGTKMRCQEDIRIIEILQGEDAKQYSEDREENRLKAKQQILKIQEENAKGYNRKRKVSFLYNLGDRVAIKRTQFGPGLKLRPKYLGPYKVTRSMGKDRYEVEKLDSSAEGPNKTSTSADHMKRWPLFGYESDD